MADCDGLVRLDDEFRWTVEAIISGLKAFTRTFYLGYLYGPYE